MEKFYIKDVSHDPLYIWALIMPGIAQIFLIVKKKKRKETFYDIWNKFFPVPSWQVSNFIRSLQISL